MRTWRSEELHCAALVCSVSSLQDASLLSLKLSRGFQCRVFTKDASGTFLSFTVKREL